MDEVHTDRGEERVVGGVITVRGDAACDLRLRGGTVQQGCRGQDTDCPWALSLGILVPALG